MDEEKIYQRINDYCTVDVEDMFKLEPADFTMKRKEGLGASDMSAILGGMNKFKTEEDVLRDKLCKRVTDEDIEIGNKPAVRKGKDLEDLILKKASEYFDRPVYKPTNQYRIRNHEQLTVNFDGLMVEGDFVIPVEAKLTTTFGDRYWKYDLKHDTPWNEETSDLSQFCNNAADWHGVPVNYFIQLQQQMMGVGAPYGYLVSLRDKDWTLHVFKIPAYTRVIKSIQIMSYKFWNKVKALS